MKKILLVPVAMLFAHLAMAQSLESIKTQYTLQQYAQAKTDIDKAITNSKNANKPEAYILKACVYATLAQMDDNKKSGASSDLLKEATIAFNKFKSLDPSMALVTDPVYQSGPISLYSAYYSNGYTDYAAKKWQDGYEKLKTAIDFSDLLIEKKLLTSSLDTNVLILGGITAENSGNKEDAAKWYGRMADRKIGGDGFESVYRFLVSHYVGKRDEANFEKYKALGAEVFPNSEYFKFDKVDFAVGLVDGFTEKLKALEAMLATDPRNFKANEIMGELIYDTLNSTIPNTIMPANAAELEAKMVVAFNNAAAAKPDFENAYIFIGDHFINKAAKAGEERDAFAKEFKAKQKPGVKPAAEDVAKKDKLEKNYAEALEAAREPYEKAAAIFATKTSDGNKSHDARTKQQYKKVCSYLSDIFAYKRRRH